MRHTDAEIAEIIRRGQADELWRLADELDPPKVDRSLRGWVVVTNVFANPVVAHACGTGVRFDTTFATWHHAEANGYTIRPLVRWWEQWTPQEEVEFNLRPRSLDLANLAIHIALREPGQA